MSEKITESPSQEYLVRPVLGKSQTKFWHEGELVELPAGWVVVPSGDAALTRRLKKQPDYWVIMGEYKHKPAKIGLCVPQTVLEETQAALESEHADPAYQKKLEAGRKYRENKQNVYVDSFEQAVLDFLAFAPRWSVLASMLAKAVTAHATPVGSGTVARTQRIPLEERVEAAVIAWMRHQTTAYDHMVIPHVAGERREVRRELARQSRRILDKYRSGAPVDLAACPLAKALNYVE